MIVLETVVNTVSELIVYQSSRDFRVQNFIYAAGHQRGAAFTLP